MNLHYQTPLTSVALTPLSFKNSLTILLLSLLLASCGGGGSSDTSEPIKITTDSWKSKHGKSSKKIKVVSKIQRRSNRFPFVFTTRVTGTKLTNEKHWQIHIDADNNPKTGYQFEDEAWSKESGIDYIIEDGYLFKSTANDNSWSWKLTSQDPLTFASNNGILFLTFPPNLIENICGEYNIGYFSLDENWQIDVFYPKANKLLNIKTHYCNIPNEHPVITLNGDSPMIVEQGTTFVDPGATATDAEDGDLTASIITYSHVDTSRVGNSYTVEYVVKDSYGFATAKWRSVFVMKRSSGITVDGNLNDWAFIPVFAKERGNTIKITDDKDNIYVSVSGSNLGENTQLFIDSDQKASTGFALDSQTGADFMVENESLSHYVGSRYNWAWDYNIAHMPLIHKNNIEMAIPKSTLKNLVNKPVFSFASIDDDWNINYYLPNISKAYTLKHSVTPSNRAPTAVNDSATTTRLLPKTINVLRNDTDADGDPLTITNITQPSKGTVSIVANKIKFVPKKSFVGATSFRYTISDGHSHSATATVSVTISAGINRVPNAVEDAPATNHTVPIKINVLQNDTDPDGDTLSVTAFTQPSFGKTTLNSDGTITFNPQGHVGSHSFSYTISDGFGGTDTTVVTIATSDPKGGHDNWPVIRNEVVSTPKNKAIFISVLSNDTDADGDVLILDQVDSGTHGTTVKVNGGVLYTPVSGYVGSDEFYYGVHDGHGHNGAGKVTITVTP